MLLSTVGMLLQMAAAPAPADARLQRDARAAQSRFEGIRRAHLPTDLSGGSAGRCDARIGRYCYWYDSTDAGVVREAKQITEARERLLSFLDSAVAQSPADGWLVGQRTRYLIEVGRAADATRGARACRAERWWCAALEGLSLHVDQRYAAADSVFQMALSEMPPPQRCEWLDLSALLADRPARELSQAGCSERAQLAERLWTLGQPLWSSAGNDLRTEHFARLTMANILARSANAYGMAWGDDSRELLVRYGWAERYSRQSPSPYVIASPSVTGHDREPSYSFFPDVRSARAMPALTSGSWRLREASARTRYAPLHIEALHELPHQLVRFPRADSMLIAVAFRVFDTALARDSLNARLSVYHNSELRAAGPRDGALWMTVPNDTQVASIEVRGVTTRRAARARYTIDPLACAQWCVSDLLLFDSSAGDVSGNVAQAIPNAITESTVSNRTPLGVLWEVHGTVSSAPVSLSLTVSPVNVSVARRLATRLHLAQAIAPVRLHWQATIHASPEGQSVTLRLPPSARGWYRVLLTIEPPGARPITTARDIELVP